MDYSLIKSCNRDISKLIRYKKRTIYEYTSNLSKNERKKIENYINNNVLREIDNYYNIVVNGNIIGCLLLTNQSDGKLLDEIYLEKKYRNKGIGKDIIKNIIKNNDIIYLWVYKLNIGAVSLYKKLGFNIIMETKTRYYMKCIKKNNEGGKFINIYLTSYGLDVRFENYMDSYNDIIDVLKNKKVAIIPNAKLESEDRTSHVVAHQELIKNNIKSKIIDLNKEKLNIKEYDALYLSGGEPKNLMDAIINSNNYQNIERFIDNGGIIIGQSAGAMIFNKEYLDTTTGNLLIMDNGFDYYDKIIVPHYNNLPKELLGKIPSNVLKINDNDRLYKLDN